MIPVLDWSEAQSDRAAFTAKLGAAVRETGFFLLANPDVPRALRDEVFGHADAFFTQPRAEKAKLSILDTPHFRGWAKPGDESLDETRPEVDSKETFNIGYDLAPDDPRVLAGVSRGEPLAGHPRFCRHDARLLRRVPSASLGPVERDGRRSGPAR